MLLFDNSVSISEIITIIGGVWTLYVWNKKNKFRQIEKIQQLMDKTRDDKTIAEVISLIDWDRISYNGNFDVHKNIQISFPQDELGRNVDRTLAIFSHICYLRSLKILTDNDIAIFDYRLHRIAQNKHILNYLFSLHHWSEAIGVTMSFEELSKYFLEHGLLRDDYNCPKSDNYECCLKLPNDYLRNHKCKYCA